MLCYVHLVPNSVSDDFLVTLEHDVTRVTMTSHEYGAGDAGGDAWSARLSAA